jgi:hypothetical protein
MLYDMRPCSRNTHFDRGNRRLRRVRFEIELHQLEQSAGILTRQCRPDDALMMAGLSVF